MRGDEAQRCSGEETSWVPKEGSGSSKLLILKQLCLAGGGKEVRRVAEGHGGSLACRWHTQAPVSPEGVDLPMQVEVSELGLGALQGAPGSQPWGWE